MTPAVKFSTTTSASCTSCFEEFLATWGFEVEGDAFFIGIQHYEWITLVCDSEDRKNRTSSLTQLGRLDFDDLGAKES